MAMKYTAGGRSLTLGAQLGSPGGQGTAYRVKQHPDLVAKIYHAPPSAATQAKIAWMIAHPPAGAATRAGHAPLAWPRELLYEGSQVAGFLMPLVDLADAADLYRLIDPGYRKQFPRFDQRPFTWRNQHQIAANLAAILASCHAEGYVVGDLNNKNAIVHRTGQVTLIDNDSFQVTTDRAVFHCGVIRPECAPPELLGRDLESLDRTPDQDNWILAVLVFMLLQDGRHPFLGVCPGEADPPLPVELVARGWYPYDIASPRSHPRPAVRPHPLMPPLVRLHPAVRELLQACFGPGLKTPDRRPTAEAWHAALVQAAAAITRCQRGHDFAATPGAICYTRFPGGYCGSTVETRSHRPLPLATVDPLTGDRLAPLSTLPLPASPSSVVSPPVNAGRAPATRLGRVQVTLRTTTGAALPAGTVISVEDGANQLLHTVTIAHAAPGAYRCDFAAVPVGAGSVVVRQAAGYRDLRQPFVLAPGGVSLALTLRPRDGGAAPTVAPAAGGSGTLTIHLFTSDQRPLPAGATYALATATGAVAYSDRLPAALPSGQPLPAPAQPPGAYTLSVSAPGYQPLTERLTIGGAAAAVHVTLHPARVPATVPVSAAPVVASGAAAGGGLPLAPAASLAHLVIGAARGSHLPPGLGLDLAITAPGGAVVAQATVTVNGASVAEHFISLAPGPYRATVTVPGQPAWTTSFSVVTGPTTPALITLPRRLVVTPAPAASVPASSGAGAGAAAGGGGSVAGPALAGPPAAPSPVTVRLDRPRWSPVPAGAHYEVVDDQGHVRQKGQFPKSGQIEFMSQAGWFTVTVTVPGHPPRQQYAHFQFTGNETVSFPIRPGTTAPRGRWRRPVLAILIALGILQTTTGVPVAVFTAAQAWLTATPAFQSPGLLPADSAIDGPGEAPELIRPGDDSASAVNPGAGSALFNGATGRLALAAGDTAATTLLVTDLATSQRLLDVFPTQPGALVRLPTLSPDGATLAYVESPGAGQAGAPAVLQQAVASDSAPVVVATLAADERISALAWNAAGTRLVASVLDATLAPRLVAFDVATGERRDFAPAVSRDATFSPDGLSAAYVVPDAGTDDIVFADATGRARFFVATSPAHAETMPLFSPDGTRIAFDRYDLADGVHTPAIWDAATEEIVPLAVSSDEATQPIWSPDGRQLAVLITQSGVREIQIFDVATRSLAASLPGDSVITWSWAP